MTVSRKFTYFLSSVLVAALLIASVSIQPASANEAVILPEGANGTNGNPELLTYACPSEGDSWGFVDVWAPAPVIADGLSSYDPVQDGVFRWTLSSDSESTESYYSQWYALSEALSLYSPDYSVGQVLSLELTGNVMDGPEVFDPTSFEFQVTVVDPSFDQGSGTITDPYIVTSQSDLEKLRCYENKHFALATDISLAGDWFPIGAEGNSWKGSLDGRGFSISGLQIENPTMNAAGLFGSADDSYFRDLTIVSPRIVANQNVGVLAGKARYGAGVENVRVIDAEVTGASQVGLLIGWKDYGGLISRTSVEGTIVALPRVSHFYETEDRWLVEYPTRIGGMVGFDDGDGTTHLRNSVDVTIEIAPEKNYVLAGAGKEISEINVARIGGYAGETDEDSTFRFIDVTSNIKIVSWSNIFRIGGVVGESESPWSELDVETAIHVVALAGADVTVIGGVFGYSDDQTVSKSNISSEILVESGNGANNEFGIDESGEETYVADIAGVGGEYDDDTSDAYVRAKTDITVRNVEYIERVAGYVGKFDDDNGVGYSDIFVSGSISLNASTEIKRVGGFANLQGTGGGKITGNRLFAATSVSTSGTAEVTDVNPFTGQLDEPDEQLAFNAYWDSTLNSDENPAEHPGLPASTSQLKNRSFLGNLDMDFNSVWDLPRGAYPELKVGIYTWGYNGSTPGGGNGATTTTLIKPAGPIEILIPKKAKQGTRVVVSGARLNRVTDVFVAGKRVAYTVRPNGTLTFKAPKLAPKKYQVRIVSDTADTEVTRKIRITTR